MKVPNGFIKESGIYRRDEYIFDGKHIIKESTLLPTKEEQEDLIKNTYETLEDCIRAVIEYSVDIGQALRTKDVYIDKVKEGEYKVSEKKSDKTQAIITPDNNVFGLKYTEIPEQDDKSLAPNKDEAKAPKEQKNIENKPKELEDLKEDENSKWKIEITVNGELTYLNRLTAKDIEEILSVANSISPTIQYESALKESTYDEDFNTEDSKEFPSEEPVEDTTGDAVSDENKEEKSIQPLDSAYFIRRPQNIVELQDKIDRHLVNMATYQIVDEIELSQEEFDNYANNLRQDTKFLKSFRPSPTNADFTCIAVKSPEGQTLLIDNSGYDSAQYVSII